MVKKELLMIVGRLSLNYGKYMILVSVVVFIVKNVELLEDVDEKLFEEFDKNLDNVF